MNNIVTSKEQLKKLAKLVKHYKLEEVRFELVMSVLFPDVYENIQTEMRKQYTLGYVEGQKSVKPTE